MNQIKQNRNDFTTHLNYIKTLNILSKDLEIKTSDEYKIKQINADKKLDSKIKLLELTKKSIQDDYKIMQMYEEYAVAASTWLPIKAYYLVYHTLCVFHYFFSGNIEKLTLGHGLFKKYFKDTLQQDKTFKFSQQLFNIVYSEDIIKFKSTNSINLRNISKIEEYEEIYKLIMKKQMKITKLNLKSDIKFKKNNKTYQNNTVCILDYLYLMRERVNYKNSNFLYNIESKDIRVYCQNYYEFVNNFLSPFEKLINPIITQST